MSIKYLKERVLVNGGSGLLVVHDQAIELYKTTLALAELKRFDLNAKAVIVICDEQFIQPIIKLISELKLNHNNFSFYSHSRINGILKRSPSLFIDNIILTFSFNRIQKDHHAKFNNASYNLVAEQLPIQKESSIAESIAVITRKKVEELSEADYICNVSYMSKSEPENTLLQKNIKAQLDSDYIRSIPVKTFDMDAVYTAKYGLIEQELLGKKANNLYTSTFAYFDEFYSVLASVNDQNKLDYIKQRVSRNKKLTILMPLYQDQGTISQLKEKVHTTIITRSTTQDEKNRLINAFNSRKEGVLVIIGLIQGVSINGPVIITSPHQNIYNYINKVTQQHTEPIILETRKKRSIMSKIKIFLRFQKIDSVDTLVNKITSNTNKAIVYALRNLKKNSVESNNCS